MIANQKFPKSRNRDSEVRKMEKRLFTLVEKNGIAIPKDKLEGLKEGDIVEIRIEKIYVSNKHRKNLMQTLRL